MKHGTQQSIPTTTPVDSDQERLRELEEAVEALRVALKPFATAFLLLPEDMPRNIAIAKHVYEATSKVLRIRTGDSERE